MNTKEIQQVMKSEDQYISLYEYLGKGSGGTNIGREVTAEAIKQGIDIKWKTLPKEAQKPEYTQVQIYPLSFLDKYFGNKTEVGIDVGASPHRVAEYDRRSVPTVIITNNGQVSSKQAGVLTESQIKSLWSQN